MADTKDYGVLRIIVENSEEVAEKLQTSGCVLSITPVWVLGVPDRPGGLAEVLIQLAAKNVIIEYMYAFVDKVSEEAQLVLRVQDEEIMQHALQGIDVLVH